MSSHHRASDEMHSSGRSPDRSRRRKRTPPSKPQPSGAGGNEGGTPKSQQSHPHCHRARATDLVPQRLLDDMNIHPSSSSNGSSRFDRRGGDGLGSFGSRSDSSGGSSPVDAATALLRARVTELEVDSLLSPYGGRSSPDIGTAERDDFLGDLDFLGKSLDNYTHSGGGGGLTTATTDDTTATHTLGTDNGGTNTSTGIFDAVEGHELSMMLSEYLGQSAYGAATSGDDVDASTPDGKVHNSNIAATKTSVLDSIAFGEEGMEPASVASSLDMSNENDRRGGRRISSPAELEFARTKSSLYLTLTNNQSGDDNSNMIHRIRNKNRLDDTNTSTRNDACLSCTPIQSELKSSRKTVEVLLREKNDQTEIAKRQKESMIQSQVQITALSKEKASAERERGVFLKQITSMKAELVDANDTAAKYQRDLKDIRGQYEENANQMSEALGEVRAERDSLQAEASDIRNEMKSQENKLSEVDAALVSEKSQRRAMEDNCASLEADLERIREENDALKAQLNKSCDEKKLIANRRKSELACFNDEKEDLSAAVASKSEAVKRLQRELATAKDQRLSSLKEIDVLRSANTELHRKAASLTEDNGSFKRQLKSLQSAFGDLKQGNKEAQALISDLEDAQTELEALKKELNQSAREKECLIEAAEDLQNNLSQEGTLKVEVQSKVLALQVELDEARLSLKENSSNLDTTKTLLDEVRQELEKEKEISTASDQELKGARATIAELVGEIEVLKSEKDSAEDEYIESLAKAEGALDQEANAKAEVEEYAKRTVSTFEAKLEKERERSSTLQTKLDESKTLLMEVRDELDNEKEATTALGQELEDARATITELVGELQVLRSEKEAAEAECIESLAKVEGTIEAEASAKAEVEELKVRFQAAKDDADVARSAARVDREALRQTYREELDASRLREEKAIQFLESTLRGEMEAQRTEYDDVISSKEREWSTLSKKCATMEENLEISLHRQSQIEQELIETTKLLQAIRQREKSLVAELEDARVKGNPKIIAEQESQISQLRKELKSRSSKYESELHSLRTELLDMTQKVSLLELERHQKEEEEQKSKSFIDDLFSELDKSQPHEGIAKEEGMSEHSCRNTSASECSTKDRSEHGTQTNASLEDDTATASNLSRVEESLRQTKVELAAALTAFSLPQEILETDPENGNISQQGTVLHSIQMLKTICKFVSNDGPVGDKELVYAWHSLGRLRNTLSETDACTNNIDDNASPTGTGTSNDPFNNASEEIGTDDDSILRDLTLSFDKALAALESGFDPTEADCGSDTESQRQLDPDSFSLPPSPTPLTAQALVPVDMPPNSPALFHDFGDERDCYQSEGRFGAVLGRRLSDHSHTSIHAGDNVNGNQPITGYHDPSSMDAKHLDIVPELEMRCHDLENACNNLLDEKEDLLNETIDLLESERAEREAAIEAAVAKVRAEAKIEMARYKEECREEYHKLLWKHWQEEQLSDKQSSVTKIQY